MRQLIGQPLNEHYRITSVLGQQSGRRTFLAEAADQTLVVIKLVLFGPDFDWADLKLFEREAETLKSLDHPAIPKYLDSFEVDTPLGKGFALVQTYIEAQSLESWVTGGRQFQEADLQPMARALLSILYYLHSCYPAVVHRDIKPSNILLSKASAEQPAKLYLIDFASVQAAQKDGTMTIVGTYGYMPPEQFSGRAKPASDLYSLGATLIYLATGKHPTEFMQDNLTLDFASHVRFSPSFTRWLTQITQPNISQRIASAQLALRQLTQSSGVKDLSQLNKQQKASSARHSTPRKITAQNPSTVLTCGDFEVISTPHELEVHFLRSRIRAPLRSKESLPSLMAYGIDGSASIDPKVALIWLSFFVLSIGIFIVSGIIDQAISPYGSVSLYGWLGMLMGVCTLSSLYIPLYWHPSPHRDGKRKIVLKINRTSQVFVLSLFTPQPNNNQKLSSKEQLQEEQSQEETCHFSKVPLNQLKLRKSLFDNRCRLIFSTSPSHDFGWLARKKLKLGTLFNSKKGSHKTTQKRLHDAATIGALPAETRLKYLSNLQKAEIEGNSKTISYQTCAKQMIITGTPREIRWLTRCISEWRNLR